MRGFPQQGAPDARVAPARAPELSGSSLERQLRWLIVIRLVVVTTLFVSLFFFQLLQQSAPPAAPGVELEGPPAPAEVEGPPPPPVSVQEPAPGVEARVLRPSLGFVFLLALLVWGASAVYFFLLRRFPGHLEAQAFLQLTVDLVLVTWILWNLGLGVSNPFSLFYLAFIAAAAVLLGRQAGFTLALLAYVLYAGLVVSLTYGWVPVVPGTAPPTDSPFLLAYNLVVHLFAFVAVGLLTAALARRLEAAQRELAEEREDLARLKVVHRDVIESIQSGILTTDLEGTVTSVNRAGTEILRRPEEVLLGTSVVDTPLFDHSSWDRLSSAATLRAGRHRSETEVERQDGSTSHIGFSISQLTDGAGRQQGYILIFQDFTRWRELEEQVRIKDRMAAVGELAAGIAHEIGNPLAAISGSVQMLQRRLGEEDREGKLLDILAKESQRLDRTIKGFLRFARPKERSVVRFDVAALLAENCELLANSPEVGEAHRLEVRLDPPALEIDADPDQVSQIFWNLARNALRAMEDGGTLTVVGRTRDDRYLLEVLDTGRGMTEEERANLFHPFQSFFDTGTGIGMAIVYRIVQEHGGTVTASPRPGGGTRITVELPVRAPAEGGREGPAAGSPQAGSEAVEPEAAAEVAEVTTPVAGTAPGSAAGPGVGER